MVTSDSAASGRAAVVGARLRAWRRRVLLTQEQLADRAGVSVRTIASLEAGRVRYPRSDTLRRLADALGLTEEERAGLTTAIGGTGGLAPMPPVGGVGCQLPMDVAGFTGRADSLTRLDRLLTTGAGTAATVVISAIGGTAGVGKTALAIHWAHQVRAHFPDGQLFVNLRGYAPTPPLRPVEALAQLLRALGVGAEQVPVEVEEAAGLYRSLVTDRRVLIVLDNARDAEQVRPLLPADPGCLVLVTSRDRLSGLVARDGARRLTLDVLSPAEADQLLARVLGQEQVQAEPEATAELARVCGFLPLALRIAAANLLDQPGQPIAGYVTKLRAGDRLAELAVDGDPQAAVGMAFEASYAALDPAAQRLFWLLGLVPGPDVTAGAAATLTGATPMQAERLLEQLAGAHLLEPRGAGRYGFHDLLRLYARRRAEEMDSESARRTALGRLLGWYLYTADAAARLLYPEKLRLPLASAVLQSPPPTVGFADDTQALAWLDAERANLVAAVQHAAEYGPRPLAWLLADTLRGYFWEHRHMADWLAVAHAGLAATAGEGDRQAQAAAQRSLGLAYQSLGDYARAAAHYTDALELATQIGWVEGLAAILGGLGFASAELGQLERSAGYLAETLALHRRTGHKVGQANALGNLGHLAREMGRLEQAADHLTQALALYRDLGPRGAQASALDTLGEVDRDRGRLDAAAEHLTQALDLARELGTRYSEVSGLQALAAVHRDAGRLAPALDLARTALTLAREIGEPRLEADALNTLGTVDLCLDCPERAADHHRHALELARRTETRYPQVQAMLGLAAVHQHTGQTTCATLRAQQALELAGEVGYRVLEGHAHTILAAANLDGGDHDRAVWHARHALAVQRATGHRLGQGRALVVLGQARRHTQGTDAAVACWRQALALFAGIGSPDADEVRALLASRVAERG